MQKEEEVKPFLMLLKDFSGGLNLKYSDEQIAQNEARDMQNCDPYSKGWFDRRKGCNIHTTDGISTETSIDNMIRFYPDSSSKILVVSTNNDTANKIWSIDDSTGAETEITGGTALAANTRIRFATYKGTLFINDGTNPIQYYTGGATKADITGTPTPPTGPQYCIHKRRMYVASGANLYRSGYGMFTTLPTTDFPAENVEPVGDETIDLTALLPQQDHIILFKENTFHKWIGTADYDFRVLDTNRPYGCIASDSAVMCEGWAVFLAHDGVRAYDGGLHAVLLSDKIGPIIDGSNTQYGMNQTYKKYARAVYQDGLYRLFYAGVNSSYANKEIVFNFRRWLESNGQTYPWYYNIGRNIGCACVYDGAQDSNEIKYGDSNAPYIYNGETGYSDIIYGAVTGGNIIDTFWKTKNIDTFDGVDAHQIKKYRKLKLSTYLQGGTLTIYYNVDEERFGSSSVAQTTTSKRWGDGTYWGDGSYWTNEAVREIALGLSPNLVGHKISITIRENASKDQARINNIEIYGKAKAYK
jgi:hypothetical protein